MFFLLRCIFWLGLVFWHLDWNPGSSPAEAGKSAAASPRTSVAHAERTVPSSFAPLVRDLARQAGAKAQDWCAGHPKDCIGALIGAAGTLEDLEGVKSLASPAPAPTLAPTAAPKAMPPSRGGGATRAG